MRTRLNRLAGLARDRLCGGLCGWAGVPTGNAAAKTGDLDQAVAYYRTASNADPGNPNFKIALERAMIADRARTSTRPSRFGIRTSSKPPAANINSRRNTTRQSGRLPRRSSRSIRPFARGIEAARPKPVIEQLRERVRASSGEPLLNPTSREPLRL